MWINQLKTIKARRPHYVSLQTRHPKCQCSTSDTNQKLRDKDACHCEQIGSNECYIQSLPRGCQLKSWPDKKKKRNDVERSVELACCLSNLKRGMMSSSQPNTLWLYMTQPNYSSIISKILIHDSLMTHTNPYVLIILLDITQHYKYASCHGHGDFQDDFLWIFTLTTFCTCLPLFSLFCLLTT